MNNKPHTEATKQLLRERFIARTQTQEYSLFIERQKNRGSGNKNLFNKGHEPLTDGLNLIGIQAGKSHWNWRGGITEKSHALRQSKKYIEWRSKVFERDNYTCVFCNRRGLELNADHHPYPWTVIFSIKNESLMWDENNGRTLCVACHNHTKKHWKEYYEYS